MKVGEEVDIDGRIAIKKGMQLPYKFNAKNFIEDWEQSKYTLL